MTTDQRPDPTVALISLAASLANGELPRPELRAWFSRAVKSWLSGLDLNTAFQVRGSASFAIRDEALRQACALLGNDPARLAQEIRRHPHRRRTGSALERHLDTALASGRTLPTSPKQLRRIVRDKTRA